VPGLRLAVLALVITLLLPPLGGEGGRLRVLTAGSMLLPMRELARAYEELHPWVRVEVEGHGSIQVIRHVTELGEQADVLVVADYLLIPGMMYGARDPETGEPMARWYVRFASNELVLIYAEGSKYSDEIREDNWYDILLRPGVRVGIPNPLIDACGYRALIALKLAEEYYNATGLFERLVTDNFDPPIASVEVDGVTYVLVPEVVSPRGGKVVVRASSILLVPLVEAGTVDYAFGYLSVARQRGLRYLRLPPQVNLGDPRFEELYRKARVRFSLRRFATLPPEREGTTIYYALTVPTNAPNRDEAVRFVRFMLGPTGSAILRKLGVPLISPYRTDNPDAVPEALRPLVEPEVPEEVGRGPELAEIGRGVAAP